MFKYLSFKDLTRSLLISIFVLLGLSGCTTEYNLATNQEETLLFGTEKEIKIGDSVAAQFEEHYKVINDVDISERVQGIFDRIIAVCDRRELVYIIKVVEEESINAISLPGGYIYIFKGVIDKVDNDDQLAGVIAHEVGHIAAKHGMKRLQASYGYGILQALAIASGDARVATGVQAVYTSLFLAHSRQDEFEADRLGVRYLKRAGYDPNEMAGFLKKLKEENEKAPIRAKSYGRTHPYVAERIAIVNQASKGELEFKDYLNLIGSENNY